jgi:hypothetical protein
VRHDSFLKLLFSAALSLAQLYKKVSTKGEGGSSFLGLKTINIKFKF